MVMYCNNEVINCFMVIVLILLLLRYMYNFLVMCCCINWFVSKLISINNSNIYEGDLYF